MKGHSHSFLGESHARNERRTWAVIVLCAAMMVLEIGGGLLFGSVALVADGLHMSTHAGALLIAALAYTYARRHTDDPRFAFGTGKLGDLAGFTSAVILAMISLLIAWEALDHVLHPGVIDFNQALPIAVLGLVVNLGSAWLLGGDHHHHGHGHGHDHGHDHGDDHGHDHACDDHDHDHHAHTHHAHKAHRDNNMRAAFVHVIADAAVSVLVILALLLARNFGWMWMDPLAGLIGAVVIASWAWTLIRDTGAILLDMTPHTGLADKLRQIVADEGDDLTDLHLWRLGPGHMGAILAVMTTKAGRTPDHYHALLAGMAGLSHVTIEVRSLPDLS